MHGEGDGDIDMTGHVDVSAQMGEQGVLTTGDQ